MTRFEIWDSAMLFPTEMYGGGPCFWLARLLHYGTTRGAKLACKRTWASRAAILHLGRTTRSVAAFTSVQGVGVGNQPEGRGAGLHKGCVFHDLTAYDWTSLQMIWGLGF